MTLTLGISWFVEGTIFIVISFMTITNIKKYFLPFY